MPSASRAAPERKSGTSAEQEAVPQMCRKRNLPPSDGRPGPMPRGQLPAPLAPSRRGGARREFTGIIKGRAPLCQHPPQIFTELPPHEARRPADGVGGPAQAGKGPKPAERMARGAVAVPAVLRGPARDEAGGENDEGRLWRRRASAGPAAVGSAGAAVRNAWESDGGIPPPGGPHPLGIPSLPAVPPPAGRSCRRRERRGRIARRGRVVIRPQAWYTGPQRFCRPGQAEASGRAGARAILQLDGGKNHGLHYHSRRKERIL
jgi:hypothetical protein